ncbi:ribosome maturation factor RimM [Hugenholtzia roseola]|uniref:ribosome maturation factor RimM n=1 Tax=Hugenholtzia roseola TaxID=1002 RepID=UPI000419EF44|nr:ribosome maturation factor RimM [Hugenholtzia roseola]
MDKKKCFELGRIIRPHGLAGEMVILLEVDNPEDYLDLDTLFIEKKGQLSPYFVESLHLQPNGRALLALEGIDSIEAAQALSQLAVWLPDSYLPELEADEYFLHELVGYEVLDEKIGRLGVVENVYELPTENALVLTYQGAEVLILMQSQWILNLDKTAKKIEMRLPEGLLEVYTQPQTAADKDGEDEMEQ